MVLLQDIYKVSSSGKAAQLYVKEIAPLRPVLKARGPTIGGNFQLVRREDFEAEGETGGWGMKKFQGWPLCAAVYNVVTDSARDLVLRKKMRLGK